MLIIVPNLPPNVNGLGDYAFLLAKRLREGGVQNLTFLVAGTQPYARNDLHGFPVYSVTDRREMNSWLALHNIIHLHYVGYAYSKRGVPVQLVRDLVRWRTFPGKRLLITFHEVYAKSSTPWKSSFWLQWVQRRLSQRLCIVADYLFTSREDYARLLRTGKNDNIIVAPVFSNVGEPANLRPVGNRAKSIVVFGSASGRADIYNRHLCYLQKAIQTLGIEKIVDIGPFIPLPDTLPVPIVQTGTLVPDQVSLELSNASFAFAGCPAPRWFAKSGVFAAFAAHKMVIIGIGNSQGMDGIISGKHYLDILHLPAHYCLQRTANHVHEWYTGHTLSKQADFLFETLQRFSGRKVQFNHDEKEV